MVWWTVLVNHLIQSAKRWPPRKGLPMAADQELMITQTVQDHLGGWYDADVARMGWALGQGLARRSPAEDDGVILAKQPRLRAWAEGEGPRAGDRWKRAPALWLPR